MRIRSSTTTVVLAGVLALASGTVAHAADPVPQPDDSHLASTAPTNTTDCVWVLAQHGELRDETSAICVLTEDNALSVVDCVRYMVFNYVPAVIAQQACVAAKL